MSSMISSQGLALATAMAVSGTAILLALRLHKPLQPTQFHVHQVSQSSTPILRSCIISSDGKKRYRKKKKKVHFADDVVDLCSEREEFIRQQRISTTSLYSNSESKVQKNCNCRTGLKGMPANRVALYNGILRDRVAHRLAYS